jgi:adenylate cyclase
MFTDMVGFTAGAQADEATTLALRKEQENLIRPALTAHQGRKVKSTGDGFLIEFESALKATECAVDIQRRVHERNGKTGTAPINLRIGIHLGDVEQQGADIFGDAVNIAARIEPVAEPGGICLSGAVHEQVRNKIPNKLEKLPPTALKGLQLPIDVYRVVLPWMVRELPSAGNGRTRLAVLPFTNMSPDPADLYFADGLTEELITAISQLRELRVIARTSVMQYKSTTKSISQIGTELGVSSVLEGSVRRAGNRLRITAQLIDVGSQDHVWATSYDRDLDDVFVIQSEIAKHVADALKVEVRASEEAQVGAGLPVPALNETEDMQAYLYFLEGQSLVWRPEEERLRQALRCFERAVERDPTFSRAYVGVARAHAQLAHEGLISWSEAIAKGKAAAEKARSISPGLAEAHAMLASLMSMADDPLELQEKEAKQALELNPNLGEAHVTLGFVDAHRGDLIAYASHCETAYRLDPLSPRAVGFLGRAYFYAGREQDALEHWKRTLPLAPMTSYRGMTDYYLSKGDLERAGAMVREMERVGPTNQYTYLSRGYLAALQGDKATATEMIRKLVGTHDPDWVGAGHAGYIYAALGDLDKFFEYEFAAANHHTLHANDLMFSPLFAQVRKDPRFKQLLELAGHRVPSPR